MSDAIEVARITIRKMLDRDDTMIFVDVDPPDLPLIEQLGMLAFAQHDTAISQMPPAPDQDEEDDA